MSFLSSEAVSHEVMTLCEKNDNNQVIIFQTLLRDSVLLHDTANKVWSADITYIKLKKEFAYLVAIIGICSDFIS